MSLPPRRLATLFRLGLVPLLSVLAIGLAGIDRPLDGAPVAAPEPEEPKLVPGGYGGRSEAGREKLLKEGGGNAASEKAVTDALDWIARHQAADGHWGLDDFAKAGQGCTCTGPGMKNDVAGTALALLPFLGHRITHESDAQKEPHAKVVAKGLKWLIAKQAQDGQFGEGYTHGLATIVLCEAYGMTGDDALRGPTKKAVDKVIDWQGPNGGFRYRPKQDGDTCVTGWHLQALKAAQLAGFDVPKATLANASDFLDRMQSDDGASYGYTAPDANQYRLRAVGLLSRQYLGWGPRTKGLTKGIEILQKTPPGPNPRDIYYFFYATQVMRHMALVQPEAWAKWNEPMRDLLVMKQDGGGHEGKKDQKGSWDPTGDSLAVQLGRLGYTSLATLTLEVYYRHVPLYRREPAQDQKEK